MRRNITYILAVVAIVVSGSAITRAAWTVAPASPPSNNTDAPVNVGNDPQTKLGSLGLNINGTYANALLIPFGNVGIGTANPEQKLDVVGAIQASVGLEVHWPGGTPLLDFARTSSDYDARFILTGDNTLNLESASLYIGSGFGYFYSSDRSLKTNITSLDNALDKVLRLNGVSFNWKDSGKGDIGVIAQDVEKVFPEAVSTNDDTGLKSVDYSKLVAPLIEAVKAQQKEIDALKVKLEALENR